MSNTDIEHLKSLIIDGKIEETIRYWRSQKQVSRDLDRQLVVLLSRYLSLKRKSHSGLLTQEFESLEYNRILEYLTNILEQYSTKIINAKSKTYQDNYVEIRLSTPLQDFKKKHKKALIQLISHELKVSPNNIKIVKVKAGSTRVFIEIPADKVDELVEWFQKKEAIGEKSFLSSGAQLDDILFVSSSEVVKRNKYLPILGIAAIILLFIWVVPHVSKWIQPDPTPKQLTIFVTDSLGNVAFENTGEINIALGNRSLNAKIGDNGRTNFGDIVPEVVGDTIEIGLKAKGWEIIGTNRFVFDGEPVKLKVREVEVPIEPKVKYLSGKIVDCNGKPVNNQLIKLLPAGTTKRSNDKGEFTLKLPLVIPNNLRIEYQNSDNSDPQFFPVRSLNQRIELTYYPFEIRAQLAEKLEDGRKKISSGLKVYLDYKDSETTNENGVVLFKICNQDRYTLSWIDSTSGLQETVYLQTSIMVQPVNY